ncbi:surface glycoprotein, partial [Natrialba sp. SSL1]
MTNETNFREKGRAVFLAALMVLSVVAMSASFAGGVA